MIKSIMETFLCISEINYNLDRKTTEEKQGRNLQSITLYALIILGYFSI